MAIEILIPTTFPLEENDLLAGSHRRIHDYLRRIPGDGIWNPGNLHSNWEHLRALHRDAAAEILELPVAAQLDCIRACARFSYWSRFEWGWRMDKAETRMQMGYENALNNLCINILSSEREWGEAEIREIVEISVPYGFQKVDLVSALVESYLLRHEITDSLRASVELVREWNASVYRLPRWLSLGAALGEQLVVHRGEKWAADATRFVAEQPEDMREQWRLLLLHCIDSEKAKPSQKWLKTTKTFIDEIGSDSFESGFVQWCRDYGQSIPAYELNQAVFKGLVWCASLMTSWKTAAGLSDVALACSQPKISENNALSLDLFNACVWALGQLDNAAAEQQLLELKSKVKRNRLKAVESALQAIAVRQTKDG